MRCLVTGSSGFIGGHLVEHLAARSFDVHAMDSAPAAPSRGVVAHAVSLLDRSAVERCLAQARPEWVFHLAAQSYPGASWDAPAETFRVNVIGTLNLLEAVRSAGLRPRVVVACSSAEYARDAGDRPLAEDARLQPSSPYGISKLAVDQLSRLYFERFGLDTVRARPFFLVGPGKRGDFCSDWARGIADIEAGRANRLAVGDLEIVRDLLDVREGVEAFCVLAERGRGGEVYNVCSGRGYVLREALEIYRSLARVPVRAVADPARLRPLDERTRVGDPGKLRALDWTPKRPIRETLEEILDYWRAKTRAAEGG